MPMKVKTYAKAAVVVFAGKVQCSALILIFKEQLQFLPGLRQLLGGRIAQRAVSYLT